MSAKTIKGITVEINGKAVGLKWKRFTKTTPLP